MKCYYVDLRKDDILTIGFHERNRGLPFRESLEFIVKRISPNGILMRPSISTKTILSREGNLFLHRGAYKDIEAFGLYNFGNRAHGKRNHLRIELRFDRRYEYEGTLQTNGKIIQLNEFEYKSSIAQRRCSYRREAF